MAMVNLSPFMAMASKVDPRPKALFFGLGMGASPKTRKILWY